MGMSASQARYLGLTARRNDNEYQAQQISQQRTTLASEMEHVATNYTNAMSNRKLLFVSMDAGKNSASTTRLTYDIITSTDATSGMSMRIVDSKGRVVVPSIPNTDYDSQLQDAQNTYNKAITNKCFTHTVTNTDGTKSETVYSGASFFNSYDASASAANPIIDKTGKQVDYSTFQNAASKLNAPDFYDFWTSNGYSFKNTDVLDKSRNYTEDDSYAKLTYDNAVETIKKNSQTSYLADTNCKSSTYLENKIRSGEWILEKQNTESNDQGDWIKTDWEGVSSIQDALDTTDDAQAEAVYTQQSGFFQNKDKQLEMEQKRLDSEHNALQTEMDSVKKVIDKNVENSFKTFA